MTAPASPTSGPVLAAGVAAPVPLPPATLAAPAQPTVWRIPDRAADRFGLAALVRSKAPAVKAALPPAAWDNDCAALILIARMDDDLATKLALLHLVVGPPHTPAWASFEAALREAMARIALTDQKAAWSDVAGALEGVR